MLRGPFRTGKPGDHRRGTGAGRGLAAARAGPYNPATARRAAARRTRESGKGGTATARPRCSTGVLRLAAIAAAVLVTLPGPAAPPASAATSPDPAAQPWVVKAQAVAGRVRLRLPGGDGEWLRALPGRKLPPFACIRTEARSSVILSVGDSATLHLKPGTWLVVGDPRRRRPRCRLLEGTLKVDSSALAPGLWLGVVGSQAATSPRGALFVLSDDHEVTRLKVLSGEVTFTWAPRGRHVPRDERLTVPAGRLAEADASGLGAPVPFDTAAELASWQRFVASGRPGWFIPVAIGALAFVTVAGAVFSYLLVRELLRQRRTQGPRRGGRGTRTGVRAL